MLVLMHADYLGETTRICKPPEPERRSRPEWLGHWIGTTVPSQCQDSTELNTFSIKPGAVLALARRWPGNGLPNQRPLAWSVERRCKAMVRSIKTEGWALMWKTLNTSKLRLGTALQNLRWWLVLRGLR